MGLGLIFPCCRSVFQIKRPFLPSLCLLYFVQGCWGNCSFHTHTPPAQVGQISLFITGENHTIHLCIRKHDQPSRPPNRRRTPNKRTCFHMSWKLSTVLHSPEEGRNEAAVQGKRFLSTRPDENGAFGEQGVGRLKVLRHSAQR